MDGLINTLGNLPGAVWVVIAVLIIVGVVLIARHGSQNYGLSFVLSWSMALCFVAWGFLGGALIYWASYADAAVVPENLTLNVTIVSAIGLVSFAGAMYRNIKESNPFFGTVYTLTQSFVSFIVIAAIAFLFSDRKKRI